MGGMAIKGCLPNITVSPMLVFYVINHNQFVNLAILKSCNG